MATSAVTVDDGRRRVRGDAAEGAGDGDDAALAEAVAALLGALAARPGFRDGELGRSADDPSLWALVTRWDGVGSYRRACRPPR